MKTIVIEGNDGSGKTTLAKALAAEISRRDGYEGYYLRFPSDGVAGFRRFFLAQDASRPTLDITTHEVVWEAGPHQSIPPLTNLLHIAADFNYTFNALMESPALHAVTKRKAEPVLVIDRELLSTIVYQVLYPYAAVKADQPGVADQRRVMLDVLRIVVAECPIIQHTLLVLLDTTANGHVPQYADVFDAHDQHRLRKHFLDLYRALDGEEDYAPLDFLYKRPSPFVPRNIDWLRGRFEHRKCLPAFSAPSETMAISIADSVCI